MNPPAEYEVGVEVGFEVVGKVGREVEVDVKDGVE